MNDLGLFLNRNTAKIRQIVLYIGDGYDARKLMDLINHTSLDKIILTGYSSAKMAERIFGEALYKAKLQGQAIPEIKYYPINELVLPDGEYALVFDCLKNNADILKLADMRPTFLAGNLGNRDISAFAVWEKYRENCKQIFLVSFAEDGRPQILDWIKDEGNDIELSVILPMYNVAKYLPQCIESVTAWKAKYIEYLFVNDGSPDNSRDIVLEYAKNDSRIKLIDKKNGGCASARQCGLENAKGRYVGFVDPDDFIDESMYRKLLRAAMVGSYDISYCGYNEYYENNGQTKPAIDVLGWPYNFGVHDKEIIDDLISYARVAIWRGIYKMEMLRDNQIGFYTDLRRFDDLPFKVETFAAAKSVVTVEEHLYFYRLARPGQDVSADDERLYVHFPIFEYLNKSIADKKKQKLTDKLQMCKIQTHRYALEKIKPEFVKEYVRQAKKDLEYTGTASRTCKLARERVGRRSALFAWAIMHNQAWMVKYLKSH